MEFRIDVDIKAQPGRVWDVIKDVERWPEWTESVRSVKRLDTGPLAVGSRARVYQPRLLPTVFRVVTLEEGRGFTWVATSAGVRATAKHYVEPVGPHSRATLSVEFHGLLGKLTARLMRSLTEHYLELEAAGLKRRSEELAARANSQGRTT